MRPFWTKNSPRNVESTIVSGPGSHFIVGGGVIIFVPPEQKKRNFENGVSKKKLYGNQIIINKDASGNRRMA